ncbi:MAG TPA: gamma-glutamyltransferase, partial [Methylomirabilota bacterium]|nr:gamma-glutamyltransferase [Methylomirabilota bacterium]
MANFEWDLPYGLRRIPVFARNVVATTQPLAAQAGLRMLEHGGNAVDAAIAAAAALTVVEPVACGFGSDGFVMVWDGAAVRGLNMTGRSPAAMPAQLPGADAMPWTGWEAVTVPGVVAGWAALSQRFGRLPFARLFEPAVAYARHGYLVSPTIARIWGGLKLAFRKHPDVMATYYRAGDPPGAGTLVTLPDHANTLERIAATGGEDLYRGRLAEKIVDYARATGGWLSAEDLAGHAPEWVEPLRVGYRGFEVHEMPPNGQGLAALIALGVLDHFDLPAYPADSADSIHLQIEAVRVAFAELHQHVADPVAMRVDPRSFLDADYLKRRTADIALGEARFPQGGGAAADAGTTYVAAADAGGMMVSYIQSSGRGWGSGLVVPGTGIALAARGRWFSLDPAHPNCLGPRKR